MLNNLQTKAYGLFTFGGKSSRDFGMVITDAPAFDKPTRKTTVYNVPGRNGAIIFQQDAYEDTKRSYNVACLHDRASVSNKIAEFVSYLLSVNGYARLEDDFEPDFYRLAYYSGGDNFESVMNEAGTGTITFACRPERFLKSGSIDIDKSDGGAVVNPTTHTAKPLIRIAGSTAVNITVNGATMHAHPQQNKVLVIDCDEQNAYFADGTNANNLISGEFPMLKPGENVITLSTTANELYITPRFFEL